MLHTYQEFNLIAQTYKKMMHEDDLRRVQHDVRKGISKLTSGFEKVTSPDTDTSSSPESKCDKLKSLT